MPEAKYLLVGSSHAALEALRAIRQCDPGGSMAMITKDPFLPYSPTILPYVASGRCTPDNVSLRDAAFFEANSCLFQPGCAATALDPEAHMVTLADGRRWGYERLLIATGAQPAMPPVAGLETVRCHVLRTRDDAEQLHRAIATTRSAVVLGAGLVGLHAAETLAKAGAAVAVVEMRDHVLSGYFDAKASKRIEAGFAAHGVTLHLGRKVVSVSGDERRCRVQLDDATELDAELLLVAAGVTPAIEWLKGSGVAIDRGILVDDTMRTTVEDVWAAGDVAQAKDFHNGGQRLFGIVPAAVEQGRIAGMAMAGDPYLQPYPGGLPINTYRFFGHTALSVGQVEGPEGCEVLEHDDGGYRRIVLSGNRLIGFASIDDVFDVGVVGELIRRRVDLGSCKDAFVARPVETGRRIMSEQWR